MILDTDGNLPGYIPIELTEGGESVPLTFKVIPEGAGDVLKCTVNEKATLYGRIGAGVWTNLSEFPLDLSAYFGGFVLVEVKAVAEDNLPGLNRVYLSLLTSGSAAANWI